MQLKLGLYMQISPQLQGISCSVCIEMMEYVIIIRDGEAAKACYKIEASDV